MLYSPDGIKQRRRHGTGDLGVVAGQAHALAEIRRTVVVVVALSLWLLSIVVVVVIAVVDMLARLAMLADTQIQISNMLAVFARLAMLADINT